MSRKKRRGNQRFNRNKKANKSHVKGKENISASDMSSDTKSNLASVRKLDFTELSGITPAKLADILKKASTGDITDFMTLAEKMEELDLHYASVLGSRKRALTKLQPQITDENVQNKNIVDYAKSLMNRIDMRDLVGSLADGLGKGFAVVEVTWNTEGNLWMPEKLNWVDQRHFQFDKTGKELRIRDKDNKDGIELPPFRYIVHYPKIKSGIPIRNGLARLAAWCFLYKNYTMKDWLAFLEVYGMPLRLGRYGANATDEDKRKLLRAVANIGSDAAAIVPQGMEIEFVNSSASGRGGLFKEKAEYLDKQISKGVLGQTMTTDDGASRSQAEVHDDVRLDILEADAADMEGTINKSLMKMSIDLNFGIQEFYPRYGLPVPENDDSSEWISNARTASEMGVALSETQIRAKMRLDKPMDVEDTIIVTSPSSEPDKKTETASHKSCSCCNDDVQLASAQQSDELDILTEELLSNWPEDMKGLIEPIRKAVAQSSTYDEFIQKLNNELPNELDSGSVIARLGSVTFKSRGLGDATDKV